MRPIDGMTEHAARALGLAKEEAERDGGTYFGTEHLLLGLLRTECLARRTLAVLGVTEETARAELTGVQRPVPPAGLTGTVTTERTKRVFELASGEADQLGHRAIGSVHLLLALLVEGRSVAAHVLRALGADLATVRAEVMRQLAASGDLPATERTSRPAIDPSVLEDARDLAAHEGAAVVGPDHVLMAMDGDQPFRALLPAMRDVGARLQDALDGGQAAAAAALRAELDELTARLRTAIAAWRSGRM